MTSDEELRKLAERLKEFGATFGSHDGYAAAFAILALMEERDKARSHGVDARLREKAAEDARVTAVDRATLAETRLERALEALKQVSMACDLYGEDLSFGDMKTVHRIQELARTVLSEMERENVDG